MDFTDITDEELDALRIEILTEQERRQIVASAPEQAEQLARRYFVATGREDGQPWVQPTGAHDAYPVGMTATHNGKTWENITPANVWEPGVTGWREVAVDGPVAWIQPLGAHDAYPLGATVTHNGQTWESTAADNVWEPGVYGWVAV